jgi:hypothetical protein
MNKSFLILCGLAVLTFACSRKVSSSGTGKYKGPKVSYAATVKPLIEKSCAPCHIPSKGGNKADFDSYDASKKWIGDMITRVHLDPTDKKFMPFQSKKPPLTAEEIAVLENWQKSGLGE